MNNIKYRKNGFTLVELLAVIIILGIIAIIVVPVVKNNIGESKQDLYVQQINTILKAADRWVVDNDVILDDKEINGENFCKLEISVLVNGGYLKDGTIEDTVTGSELSGSVLIKWENNQYKAVYINNDDTNHHSNDSYITGSSIKNLYLDNDASLSGIIDCNS